MFSIARARLTVLLQLLFLVLNGIGVFLSFVYNHETPELYKNNSHHKMGWALTWIAVAWALAGMVRFHAEKSESSCSNPYRQVTTEAMDEHQRLHEPHALGEYRWSDDSDRGTDHHAATLCQSSRSNSWNPEDNMLPSQKSRRYEESESDMEDDEKHGVLGNNAVDKFFSRHSPRVASGRGLKLLTVIYMIVERLLLPLGFAATATGAVAYGGIAREKHIFNVLAHFIKGGIFFWYGLLTFGRWMGSFSDFGWAWNLKPGREIVGSRRAWVPSAEFTESFVIFLYGASNVFLEHLAAWGKAWTAMDLEHVSITILFFGGGLVRHESYHMRGQWLTCLQLGMLVESPRIRNLLNSSIATFPTRSQSGEWQTPRSYAHSLNPIPGLVILLLGLMMSSHTQHSVVSSAIHKQWGTLFVSFALARGVTYIILWLKPPTTYIPQRPPSEIIAAFCLISGGIIFIASNADTVHALEVFDLDAMFVFTVVMGLTALLMAWQMVLLAVKARMTRRSPRSLPPVSALSPA